MLNAFALVIMAKTIGKLINVKLGAVSHLLKEIISKTSKFMSHFLLCKYIIFIFIIYLS
jgi:hypothetical protein